MDGSGFLRRIADGSGFSSDALPGLPIVEIAGTDRVLIENHSGICSYDSKTVCIRVTYGAVVVEGESLRLVQMQKDKVIIRGKIYAVSLNRG